MAKKQQKKVKKIGKVKKQLHQGVKFFFAEIFLFSSNNFATF
jgi:hypothetical protein